MIKNLIFPEHFATLSGLATVRRPALDWGSYQAAFISCEALATGRSWFIPEQVSLGDWHRQGSHSEKNTSVEKQAVPLCMPQARNKGGRSSTQIVPNALII